MADVAFRLELGERAAVHIISNGVELLADLLVVADMNAPSGRSVILATHDYRRFVLPMTRVKDDGEENKT